MDELLDNLKSRIKNLLDRQDQLQQAQQQSKTQQSSWQHEKRLLHEKHQHAITQIEKMIARLKLLEKPEL